MRPIRVQGRTEVYDVAAPCLKIRLFLFRDAYVRQSDFFLGSCLSLSSSYLDIGLTSVARQVCLFYLILRGLDTIEDDMTLPDEKKQPILRQFHKLAVQPDWTFNDCGPNEKDRDVLVDFADIVEEVRALDPQ